MPFVARLAMTSLFTAAAIGGVVAGPAAAAPAPVTAEAGNAAATTSAMPPNYAENYLCATYIECWQARETMRWYWNVSDIKYRPPNVTCPGGCGEAYYFKYWR